MRVQTITTVARIFVGALVIAAIAGPVWWLARHLHGSADLEPAAFAYPEDAPVACLAGSRPGPAGSSPHESTPGGILYLVKTPANYDAKRAHPLIVVYAPHLVSRTLVERYVGLTHAATAAGFVVAYADSHRLTDAVMTDLATIPERVAARWCIDRARIYLTGHSDGATVATAVAVLRNTHLPPAAIAPSAAGFRREDLDAYACPPPLSVMVLHNRGDRLFPGYGREAAGWWAMCNGCDPAEAKPRADGCLSYPGCAGGVTTLYCESEGTHFDWPDRNQAMLEFFRSAG